MPKTADEPWNDDPFQPPTILDFDKAKAEKSGKSGKGWKSSQPRCYESHPAYPVAEGVVIYGGACSYPIVKDADIYGGFDGYSMHMQSGHYPWQKDEGPIEFLFRIPDMGVPGTPSEVEQFKNMITWLAEQLIAGKKVHVGCIGGHGRTGMVLSALRKHMAGDENATQHVRDNYCKKAVESTAQVEFLFKHFGIAKVTPTKSYTSSSSSKGSQSSFGFAGTSSSSYGGNAKHVDPPETTGKPMNMAASLWGVDE
jgi:hypothetical protein